MTAGELPTIDISCAGEPTGEIRSEIVSAISAACEDIGFFALVGHGIAGNVLNETAKAARSFFDLPNDSKLEEGRTEDILGGFSYFPYRAESLASSATAPTQADLKESIDFGPGFHGAEWPGEPVGLEPAFRKYHESLGELSTRLRHIFMAALGLPEKFLDDKFEDDLSSLRVLNYPELSTPPLPGQLRAGVHTDYGFLTILHSENKSGGLEVRNRDGSWLSVIAPPGSFVVNIGDALMRWTNDHWVSTPHRVAVPEADASSSRRQSIAYFCNPSANAIIDCLPGFSDPGNPVRYSPISYGEYAEQCYERAHGETRTFT